MRRLQRKEWKLMKPYLHMTDYYISKTGNIRGEYTHIHSGKKYIHWLNDDEKKEFYELSDFWLS